jgi:hypothetical protein
MDDFIEDLIWDYAPDPPALPLDKETVARMAQAIGLLARLKGGVTVCGVNIAVTVDGISKDEDEDEDK